MVRKFVSGWLEISDEDPAAGGTAPAAADGTPTVVDPGAEPGTTPGGTPPLDTAPTGDVPPVDVPAEPVPVEAQPDGQPPINPEAPAVPDQPSADPAADPASTGTGPEFPGTDLHRNDHQHTPSDDVRTWQAAATDNGIDVGKVDGFFGPRTENGVRQAQTGAGVDATGVIDAATWPLAWS